MDLEGRVTNRTMSELEEVDLDHLLGPETGDFYRTNLARARSMGATHLVQAENLQMGSREFGKTAMVMVGPGLTYGSPEECRGRHLNDLPSQRMYFTKFSRIPDPEDNKE